MAGDFSVSDHGTAHYSIPIIVPPGRLGLEPQLSFNYEGNKNDGMMGPGWRLSGFSAIERCVKTVAQDGEAKPVFLTQEDGFCLDGARLMLGGGEQIYGAANTWYQTELDTFSQIQLLGPIEADGKYIGPSGFRVYRKSGQVLEYGPDRNSVGSANGVARVWALSAIYDRVGGAITISYLKHTEQDRAPGSPNVDIAELVPESIEYGGIATSAGTIAPSRWVSFHYQDRQEPRFRYANDIQTFSMKYLDSIETRTAEKLVRRYELSYLPSPNSFTRLSSIRECVPDTGTGTNVCLPSTKFDYGGLSYSEVTAAVLADAKDWRIQQRLDMDGDGKDELVAELAPKVGDKKTVVLKLGLDNNLLSTTKIDPDAFGSLTTAVPFTIIDINRDGKDDLLWEGALKISDGQTFTSDGSSGGKFRDMLLDVNGDGILDVTDGTSVRLGDTHSTGETLAIQTPGMTKIDMNGVRLFAVDLYGSGSQQVVYLTNDQSPTNERYVPTAQYWPADANANPPLEQSVTATGVSRINEVAGVRPLWSSRIRLLDINGDGLNDILELRSVPDSVSAVYALWINKGSGHFELITPWFIGPAANRSSYLTADEFDRAVVIDYDGDGSEDLLFPQAGENNAVLYRSTVMPGLSPAFSVSVSDIFIGLIGPNQKLPYLGAADINGDGNRDIVFTQDNKLRAYLGSNGTAGLLSSVTNGLRKRISISYGSSDVYDAGDCVSDDQTTCLQRVSPVVKSDSEDVVDASNNVVVPGPQHTYSYRAGRKGLGGRGFYGFAERSVTALAADGALQSLTQLSYHNEEFGLAGLLKSERVTTATSAATTFSSSQRFDQSVSYQWSLHPSISGRPFPALDEITSTHSDSPQDNAVPLVTRDTTYPSRNGYGDVEDEVTTTSTSADGVVDVREVVTSYTNDYSNWLISRPDTVTTTDAPVGASPVTRVQKYVFYADTGVLHQTIREPNDPELYLETRYDRDGYGNIGSVHSIDSSGYPMHEARSS